ncbi:MAG: PPOX class F420-dependent oxidoreductase [Pseudonocardia sp.]|nr:PPOX class F420-dependent oxidoreductase [Pseudonocardia sp.]
MPDQPDADAVTQVTARFTPAELDYLLTEPRLGRLATADGTGAPHVVPVGWSYNHELGTIDISGRNFVATRKYRNVQANPRAAFVVDEVLPPFRPRSITVQGTAQALGGGEHGREAMIRIAPTTIISWGLDDTAPPP